MKNKVLKTIEENEKEFEEIANSQTYDNCAFSDEFWDYQEHPDGPVDTVKSHLKQSQLRLIESLVEVVEEIIEENPEHPLKALGYELGALRGEVINSLEEYE